MSKSIDSLRRFTCCLLVCCLASALPALAFAGVDPKLQARLDAARVIDVIPVIITLKDRVDLTQYRDPDRALRRGRLVAALRDRAARSQRGLRALLGSQGVAGIRDLWLINAVAANLPVAVINRVAGLPAVDGIYLDETLTQPVMETLVPDMTIDDVTVSETAGSALFTVSLSGAATDTVTVDYATVDVTALNGTDYTAVSDTLTFLPGETVQTIPVPITDDSGIENDETFQVSLGNAVNATLVDGSGTGTIIDDDMPRLAVDDVSLDESGFQLTFTVTRSGSTAPVVLVNYATADDTAVAGSDYTAASGVLAFATGVVTQKVFVTLLDDQLAEGDETFLLLLSNPFQALLQDASGTGTIIDNDAPALGIQDVGVTESAGSALFNVPRYGDPGSTVTVEYTTVDGTALAGQDYTPVSGILTYGPGVTSQTIAVPVTQDQTVEGDESFSVVLSNISGAALLDDTGIGTIFGDQPPTGTTAWNLDDILAPDVWALGFIGQGVVVANMDSGVDITNPDLAARWRGNDSNGNSWYDVHGEHPVTPSDTSGHGTRSMGLIVSAGEVSGVPAGVAPGAQWIAVKVWDDAGNAQLSNFTEGLQWFLDPDGDPATDDAPDVVNHSWGFDGPGGPGTCDEIFRASVQALRAAGIAEVFSAGNNGALGAGSSISPANYPEGYAVGTVNSLHNVSGFSARGPSACDGSIYPELVAPGEQVQTTDLSAGGAPSFITVSGTSFSAPHVAGAMALLLSAFPDTGVTDLENALLATAADLGVAGADNEYGHGLIDVLGAYNWLAADTDGDGVRDLADNCINVPNGPLLPDAGGYSQRDTDGDGYGNPCDADFNADLGVNTVDFALFRSVFGQQAMGTAPYTLADHVDLNGDGQVNTIDFAVFRSRFGGVPGPSGLNP